MTERRNGPSGAAPHRPPKSLFKNELLADATVKRRVGVWSGLALLSLIGAILVARSPVAARSTALNEAHVVISSQARQLERLISQNDSETRRLAAAMGTLNSDRDRLYQRVTELERNLDGVTGSVSRLIARPSTSTPPPTVNAPQSVPSPLRLTGATPPLFSPSGLKMFVEQGARVETTASTTPKPATTPAASAATAPLPAIPEKPATMAAASPPPAATTPSAATAAASAAVATPAAAKLPLGIDLGSANSIEGLRAIWESTRKAYPKEVADLQPVITVQEPKNGLGLQLRLVAGPLPDAQSIETRCAALIEATRPCAGAAYDGQRLPARDASVRPAAASAAAPAPKHPPKAARSEPKSQPKEKPQRFTLPSLLGGGD